MQDFAPERAPRRRLHRQLYLHVLVAIALGVLVGYFAPSAGAALKPLGDGFVKLVKMIIAPVIFLSIVTGIGRTRQLQSIGRVAAMAFIYFLCFSTLALAIGLVVANVFHPGAGMNVDPAQLDPSAIADYAHKAHDQSVVGFLTDIIPDTLLSALVQGNILQVVFLAVLVGMAMSLVGAPAEPLLDFFDRAAIVVFRLVAMLMRLAPIGAFGAMAFTIGKYGLGSLVSLAGLVASFYLTSFLFVAIVLGAVARYNHFSLWRLLRYLRSELLLVLGTSSSEAALPSLMEKLETAGCSKRVVGLVVPTGYSFNLDGTNIYMTLAALFIAQACNVHLSLGQQLMLLAVAMVSSKGAAGVTGAGFITLAATLTIVPAVPVAALTLILGIDRFMSECRSLTNFIGNAVATVVVARWDGELDVERLALALGGEAAPNPQETERIVAPPLPPLAAEP